MPDRPKPAYGTPNWELISRWLELPSEDDGPFWALNLMKYHAVAQYAEGDGSVTGREADDAYAPLGPLAAVGARVAFLGDVVEQPLGEPGWDRVGIVRYPSRAAFFAMQQREDFKQQHQHKEAGMEFTIVMSCLPESHEAEAAGDGALLLVVECGGADRAASGAATSTVVDFSVEGVIVGDERRFDRARFLRAADAAAVAAVVSEAAASDEAHVLVLEPSIDNLIRTIATPVDPGPTG